MNENEIWSTSLSADFWKDLMCGEHVLHVYDDPGSFIDTLASFVGTGINADESVILLLTPEHQLQLESKLREHVMQLDTLVAEGRYIALNAAEVLNSFMEDGLPNRDRFRQRIFSLFQQARNNSPRRIRAFGEMVALLWESGNHEATHLLEKYWNELCETEEFVLLCAYPRTAFGTHPHSQNDQVCQAHSRILRDSNSPLTHVMYRGNPVRHAS